MPASPEPNAHEEAWSSLFKALAVIKAESRKPGFARMGFKDGGGRTWAMKPLSRHAAAQFEMIRRAADDER